MENALSGLFAHIVNGVHRADSGAVTLPLEIAEIAARWAPYPAVRGQLDLATAEDYEHLLMRLLSGEDGYVFADESLQDDLRRELASANPDLTALRTYGAARVTLARGHVAKVLGIPQDELAGARASSAVRAGPADTRSQRPADPTAPEPAARVQVSNRCPFCAGQLPLDRTVKFCPSCGLNVITRRCSGCSAELAPGWRFCVECGRAAGGGTREA